MTETVGAGKGLTWAGIALTLLGLTHFAIPDQLTPAMSPVFPTNTRTHILINGSIETVLGIGLSLRRTRPAAALCLLLYGGYLAASVVRNR